jgi:hypothetical protein
MSIRAKLEETAEKFDLSGSTTVTLYNEYSEECHHYLDDYRDDVFTASCFSDSISDLLVTFDFNDVNDENEVFELFLEEYSVDDDPNMFSWVLLSSLFDDDTEDDTAYEYEEALAVLKDEISLYDETQPITNYATPTMSKSQLDTFITDNYNEMCDTIEWSMEQYDHKRGNATVYASFKLTIDQVMNVPDYAMMGWTVSVSTKLGMITLE